jgi:hypothetical protein
MNLHCHEKSQVLQKKGNLPVHDPTVKLPATPRHATETVKS